MSDPAKSHDAPPAHDETTTTDASAHEEANAAERLARANNLLDFKKLDLEVDTIDERISPSETNVFDK